MNHIKASMPAIHIPPKEKPENCPAHGAFTARCHIGNVWTQCPGCIAEDDAKKAEADKQAAKDEAKARWAEKLGRSGIPERFQDRTLPRYEARDPGQVSALQFATQYAEDFHGAMKTGRSAIFAGKPGTGKTHLAAGIGLRVMRMKGASVFFTTSLRAIRSIKDTWTRGSGTSESEAIASLVFPDLLILDEVGVQYGSDAEKVILFDFLNERYERKKPCILLSNLTAEGVRDYLGDRIFDRMREGGGAVIPFGWESYRGGRK